MTDKPTGKPTAGSPLTLYLGDVVRLRKPHPCGAFEWTIVRLGADIGLRCHGCNHRVLLARRTLEKRLKTFISRGPLPFEDAVASDQGLADVDSPGSPN
ncbi:MAG: DUF951 domain-containing protein [Chloroflexota bacterium]|nr:DUF951 domain-containing protein [Chloroflexota bacterium]